uniref:Uncharacterized protein n=1 Tax=Sphaerodactylus townsendi TaxID=933632 RepID=A0ACB8FQ05_9SAUR
MVVAVKEKGKANPGSCTGTITLNIQNVNDEAPVFLNTSDTHLNISENLPFGTLVARLTAADRDIGDTVHYEFVGSYRGFTINADTGDITITFPLDYEDPTVPQTRMLEVRAFDNDRQHSATALLIITLQDVNDNFPLCPQDIYVKEVTETIPIGTPLVTLICGDKDGTAPSNSLSYTLTLENFSNETFTLEDHVIKVGPEPLNYDSVAFAALQFKHTLIVQVSDGGTPSLTSTVTVIVKVTRANEIAPHTGTKTFNVFENSKIGTVVGTVNFTDEDWPINNLKWTIIGDNMGDPPRFYIESNTAVQDNITCLTYSYKASWDFGIIKVLNALDRETKYQYVLRVRATDLDNDIEPDPKRQKSGTSTVTINILVNETLLGTV